MKRRTFIRSSFASAAVFAFMGANGKANAAESVMKDSSKNSTLKTPHPEEPFHLGMAGWTFHKFDLQKTLEDHEATGCSLSLYQGFPPSAGQ